MDDHMSLSERMDVDISKVCRLCLKGNEVLAPIFPGHQNGSGISLPNRIMACAQVKVAEGDGLPPNVCTSCLSQVDRSYQFKILCERSDSALRGNIKSETQSDDDCSDTGEGWDMTKFTPEVIIKEESDENNLSMNGNANDGLGYYGTLHGNHPPSILHDLQNSSLIQPPSIHHGETDSLSLRLSQPVDLRTTNDGLMLNGLVFPLPSALSNLPPPGPSNNSSSSRSRRCRSGDKLFKCRQCNKSYSFSSALSRHKAVHNTALRPHVCQICKKGFTDIDKLMRHEKTHNMDFVMTCDLCHRPFRSYSSFQRHRARGVCEDVVEEEGEHLSSPLAQSSPEIVQQLVKTERPATPPPPAPPPPPPPPPVPRSRDSGKGKPEFKCSVCQKLFATRGSLDVHSTIHTGVRPFVCSVCHKSFRHKVNLMEHFQRKHSQVRPYICDVCAARFVTKQELVRHYRKHIGD